MKDRLRNHFSNLGERDRTAVKLMAFLLPVLIYLLAVKPAFDFYQTQRQAYIHNHELLHWMRTNQSRVAKAQTNGNSGPAAIDLIQMVSGKAEQHKISFDRIQPTGDQRVKISSEKVSFEDVVKWLWDIQNQGLTLENVRLESRSEPGSISFQASISKQQ